MAETVRCPACGATNPAGAQWCGQCFAGFAGAPTPSKPTDQIPAGAAPPPSAPRGDRSVPVRPPADPPRPPGDRSRPDTVDPAPAPGVVPAAGGWTCSVCGFANPVSADVCASCRTSIFETFGAGEDERPEVDVSSAALWSILPGGGHFRTGQGALGLAVAGLIVSTLVFGLLLLGGSRRTIGIVLLAVSVVAWAISVYDASRLAAGNQEATLLRPKVVTAVMGLVFAAVIIGAVSLTGGDTP